MTYSIVARDPATGELGVAVQSHWFGVGAVVPVVRPGIGAVATQSVPDPAHGARILDALAGGAAPDAAIAAVLDGDEGVEYRQIGVVDASGRASAHTGPGCMAEAGHHVGDGFAVQANIMLSDAVWPAMAAAFTATDGPLAERLLAALDAAQAEGGDVRGQQSAAIVVDAAIDLRVEDHPEPLAEMRRLLTLKRAYIAAEAADEAMAEGRTDAAAELYERAGALAPQVAELAFWAGLSQVQRGDEAAGIARVRAAIERQPGLGTLLERLGPDVAPAAAAVRSAL